MAQLITLKKSATLAKSLKEQNKSVGFVSGSFDVCHLGHLNLFKFAKKHVDVLFVGLDHDLSITLTKGTHRPINSFKQRSKFLEEITSIDYIFLMEHVAMHGTEEAFCGYKNVIDTLAPTHIFTHKFCDRHWQEKKKLAESTNIIILFDNSPYITNSGILIQKLIS